MTSCPGGYARVDLARGEGKVLWPVPADLPVGATTGVQKSSKGLLAVIYHSSAAGMVLGIADTQKWTRAPAKLPHSQGATLLGLAWKGDVLEVALDAKTEVRILSVAGTEAPKLVSLERAKLCESCELEAAYSKGGTWSFVGSTDTAGFEVSQAGARTEKPVLPEGAWRKFLALQVSGVTQKSARAFEGALTAKGAKRALSKPPTLSGRWMRGAKDYVSAGEVKMRDRWVSSNPKRALFEEGAAQVLIDLPKQAATVELTIGAKRGLKAAGPLGQCKGFGDPILVSRKAGGHWIFGAPDCFTFVDAGAR